MLIRFPFVNTVAALDTCSARNTDSSESPSWRHLPTPFPPKQRVKSSPRLHHDEISYDYRCSKFSIVVVFKRLER